MAIVQRLLQLGLALADLFLALGLQSRIGTVRPGLAQGGFQPLDAISIALLAGMFQLTTDLRFLAGAAFLGLGQAAGEGQQRHCNQDVHAQYSSSGPG